MWCMSNQGGDFSKFCGLLRIYELYLDFRQFGYGIFFYDEASNEHAEKKIEHNLRK